MLHFYVLFSIRFFYLEIKLEAYRSRRHLKQITFDIFTVTAIGYTSRQSNLRIIVSTIAIMPAAGRYTEKETTAADFKLTAESSATLKFKTVFLFSREKK